MTEQTDEQPEDDEITPEQYAEADELAFDWIDRAAHLSTNLQLASLSRINAILLLQLGVRSDSVDDLDNFADTRDDMLFEDMKSIEETMEEEHTVH